MRLVHGRASPLPFRGGAGGGGYPDSSELGITIHARHIDDGDADLAILDDPERARYHRFARQDDARRYLVGRDLLKTVLGDALGLAPHKVTVSIGQRDRPFVAGGPDFNLSHSGAWVVLALARTGRVGVDIEPLMRDAEVRRIVGRIAQASELAGFADHAALHVWCIKEAVAKAIGEGLYLDFQSITIDSKTLPVIAIDGAVTHNWSIARSYEIPGHLLVTAHRRPESDAA